MRKLTLTIMLLGLAGAVYAWGHSWSKMSEAYVNDAYGNEVVQCIWVCNSFDHGEHTTVTQGYGYCPRPY